MAGEPAVLFVPPARCYGRMEQPSRGGSSVPGELWWGGIGAQWAAGSGGVLRPSVGVSGGYRLRTRGVSGAHGARGQLRTHPSGSPVRGGCVAAGRGAGTAARAADRGVRLGGRGVFGL